MAVPLAATDQRARADERADCSGASGRGWGIGSRRCAARALLDCEDEYGHAAEQQVNTGVHPRQLAEVKLAELQVELADALFGLLVGGVEAQLLFEFCKLGRFQRIFRPDAEAARDHREADQDGEDACHPGGH